MLLGFSDAVTNISRSVDVIWLEGNVIIAMFGVESTTISKRFGLVENLKRWEAQKSY